MTDTIIGENRDFESPSLAGNDSVLFVPKFRFPMEESLEALISNNETEKKRLFSRFPRTISGALKQCKTLLKKLKPHFNQGIISTSQDLFMEDLLLKNGEYIWLQPPFQDSEEFDVYSFVRRLRYGNFLVEEQEYSPSFESHQENKFDVLSFEAHEQRHGTLSLHDYYWQALQELEDMQVFDETEPPRRPLSIIINSVGEQQDNFRTEYYGKNFRFQDLEEIQANVANDTAFVTNNNPDFQNSWYPIDIQLINLFN